MYAHTYTYEKYIRIKRNIGHKIKKIRKKGKKEKNYKNSLQA